MFSVVLLGPRANATQIPRCTACFTGGLPNRNIKILLYYNISNINITIIFDYV
jgi:hypothetical protein